MTHEDVVLCLSGLRRIVINAAAELPRVKVDISRQNEAPCLPPKVATTVWREGNLAGDPNLPNGMHALQHALTHLLCPAP